MIEVLVDGEWVERDPVEGDKIRKTVGEGDFAHYIETTHFVIPAEEISRTWRNSELTRTDWIVPVTDHPQHAIYMSYRQALRDWPSTSDFPDTKPILG